MAYGRQAGEKALARSAPREAMRSFEQALSALPHLPKRRDTLEQAVERTRVLEVLVMEARCQLALGEAQLRAGCPQEAHALAQRALTLARAHQEQGHQAYALCLLGDIEALCEPLEGAPAEDHYRQALALAHGHGYVRLREDGPNFRTRLWPAGWLDDRAPARPRSTRPPPPLTGRQIWWED